MIVTAYIAMENMDLLWLTVNNKLGKMKLVANGRFFFSANTNGRIGSRVFAF